MCHFFKDLNYNFANICICQPAKLYFKVFRIQISTQLNLFSALKGLHKLSTNSVALSNYYKASCFQIFVCHIYRKSILWLLINDHLYSASIYIYYSIFRQNRISLDLNLMWPYQKMLFRGKNWTVACFSTCKHLDQLSEHMYNYRLLSFTFNYQLQYQFDIL